MTLFAVACCAEGTVCELDHPQHEQLNSAPGSRVGTPAYLAPEVILNTRGSTYDGKVGVALFAVLALLDIVVLPLINDC